MKRVTTIAMMAVFFALTFTHQALAQSFCAERTKVLETLAKDYSETLAFEGLANSGGVLEVITSPGGSWTILVTQPSGMSCVMATGQNWETTPKVSAKPIKPDTYDYTGP